MLIPHVKVINSKKSCLLNSPTQWYTLFPKVTKTIELKVTLPDCYFQVVESLELRQKEIYLVHFLNKNGVLFLTFYNSNEKRQAISSNDVLALVCFQEKVYEMS